MGGLWSGRGGRCEVGIGLVGGWIEVVIIVVGYRWGCGSVDVGTGGCALIWSDDFEH